MVAMMGRGWQLAPSLQAMVAEADRLAPKRRRASDGSIGDPAHKARVSDHNPSGGWVHALDLTHDPRGGFDAHAMAQRIIKRRDPRIKYVISNRRIYGPGSRYGWAGGPYTGANPHTAHAHFSVLPTSVGRFDVSPWFGGSASAPEPPNPELIVSTSDPVEDDMPYLLIAKVSAPGDDTAWFVDGDIAVKYENLGQIAHLLEHNPWVRKWTVDELTARRLLSAKTRVTA